MKKFIMIFLAVFLAIAAIGAIATWFTPNAPDNSTDTGTDSTTDTNTDTSTDSGSGDTNVDIEEPNDTPKDEPSEPEIIEIENVAELTTALETIESGAVIAIPATIEFSEPISLGNKEVTFIFSEDFDKPVSVQLEEGKLTIMNGHFNGIDIGGKGTLILDNVMSLATTEGDSGLALLDGADITVKIVGNVSLTGAKDGDGIEVPEGTKLFLTGETLVAVGNNGLEYSEVEGYGNTDDESYLNKTGSGIGNAHKNIGLLTVKDMTSLTVMGYGNKAFGLGGGDKSIVTIENTVIEYAKGGYAQATFLTDEKGKGDEEGGAAIGVGCGVDGDFDSGTLIIKDSNIKIAVGGSKAAGIGALYWTSAHIEISNSVVENVTGGTASAGIGGSRVMGSTEGEQAITIIISDSTINANGGEYASGIGSGYDTYCSTNPPSPCHIEILGESNITAKGGKYGAGIGTGFHCAGLTGFITDTVTVNASCGDENFYKDTYTTAQNIGYGVTDPEREMSLEEVTFTIAGEAIENPVDLIATDEGEVA